MDRYITLSRDDDNFIAFLSGSFSSTESAIPVQSFDVCQQSEKITFLVTTPPRFSVWQKFKIYCSLFRFEVLPMTIAPPLVTLVWPGFYGLDFPVWQVALAMLSILALHAGIFSLNDYVDHMTGVDRLSERSGSRVIQTGKVKAFYVLRLSLGALLLSLLLALPILHTHPDLLLFGLMATLFGAFGYIYARSGYRRLILGGFSVFFVFGPLLVYGTAALVQPDIGMIWPEADFIWLSAIFGLCATMYSQGRQLSSMLVDHQVGLRTLAVRLGFDGAKYWLLFLSVFTQILVLLFCWQLDLNGMIWWLPAYATFVGFRLSLFIRDLKSPLGSRTVRLGKEALYYEGFLALCLGLSFWLIR